MNREPYGAWPALMALLALVILCLVCSSVPWPGVG